MVPATAVPSDEPRLDTLRDTPEISPCCWSGKLDCTTLTDGVSIVPRPTPMSRSPGTNDHGVALPEAITSSRATPTMDNTKPPRMRLRCDVRRARRAAANEETMRPRVVAEKMTPVSMASKPRTTCRYAETTNDTPLSNSHCAFWVTIPRFEVRLRNRLRDTSGSRPARSLRRVAKTNHVRTNAQRTTRPRASHRLLSVARMPRTRSTNPTAERTAPPVSNSRVGSGATGSLMRRLSRTMTTMMRAWNPNAARQLIAEVMRP